MKVRPLHSKILVKLDEVVIKDKTDGGIYLTENATIDTTQKTGVVVELGTDQLLLDTIKIGDKLLMPMYSGLIVDINKEEHLIVDFYEVLAVLEKESCLTLI